MAACDNFVLRIEVVKEEKCSLLEDNINGRAREGDRLYFVELSASAELN